MVRESTRWNNRMILFAIGLVIHIKIFEKLELIKLLMSSFHLSSKSPYLACQVPSFHKLDVQKSDQLTNQSVTVA